MSDINPIREGETALPTDPARQPDAGPDAEVVFIGRIHSPWVRGTAPRNISKAREAAHAPWIELAPEWEPALAGLEVGQAIFVLYWMDRARRDLLTQKPAHASNARGTFSLRSPNRPNPVALAAVRITSLSGTRIGIDAIDCFDGTPVIDIKPWSPSIDIPPG